MTKRVAKTKKPERKITWEIIPPGSLGHNRLNSYSNQTPEERKVGIIDECARILSEILLKKVQNQNSSPTSNQVNDEIQH